MIQVKREGGDRKPPCRLVGTDGNAFALIGRVREALRAAGLPERAREVHRPSLRGQVLRRGAPLCFEYVEVE